MYIAQQTLMRLRSITGSAYELSTVSTHKLAEHMRMRSALLTCITVKYWYANLQCAVNDYELDPLHWHLRSAHGQRAVSIRFR